MSSRVRVDLRGGALAFLVVASPALVVASLASGWAAAWGFALLGAAFPVALMALGALRRAPVPRRSGRPGATVWLLLALLLVLEGTAAGVLALSGGVAADLGAARLAGFPLATVIQVLGFWLLPLPIAALGYALTFDRAGITDEDLARLRARAARGGAEGRAGGG